MNARPRVRVGIVSFNTSELLDRCLAALPAALGGLDAEVVVVDNASSDDSVARASAHPVRVVANDANVGYARAMNQALAGDADVVIACNPDTEPSPGSLQALVETLLADPARGLVVPRLLESDGSLQHSVYRYPSPATSLALALLPSRVLRGTVGRRLWLEGCADHEQRTEVDWAIGAVHVIRAAALAGAAPYDERWFMYVEDLDLCWRLRRGGWQVWLDGPVAIPHVGNVAGAAAWGAARTRRWQWATYDWVALRQGAARQRLLAAVNLVATVLLLVRPAVAAPMSSQARRRLRHRWATQRPLLRVHARAAVLGVAGSEREWGPPEVSPGRSGR
jgi:GT2 family glycosyltransferase